MISYFPVIIVYAFEFLGDVVMCALMRYMRRRIVKELEYDDQDRFMYYLLPTTMIGVLVPLAYLGSEGDHSESLFAPTSDFVSNTVNTISHATRFVHHSCSLLDHSGGLQL